MTREIRLNNMSLRIYASLLLVWMLAGCQTFVEHNSGMGSDIYTMVHKDSSTLFSTGGLDMQHAIYVTEDGFNASQPLLLSEIMKSQGFNVVSNKKEADYVMRVNAYVTMPFKEDGRGMPYKAEYLLSMSEDLPIIKPLLQPDAPPRNR